jgi:GGDEF domain-containing protein
VETRTGFAFSTRRDIYDDETGVYARWYFEQRLNEECSRARRQGDTIAVICLAVDERSAITAGTILRKHVRDYDLIGRAARTRYAVAVLDADPEAVEAISIRLQATVSIGSDLAIAWYPTDGEDAQRLLECATERVLGAEAV